MGQIKQALDADVTFTGSGGRQLLKLDENGNIILGDASAQVSIDGALTGTQATGLGAGKLLLQAASIANADFLKIDGTAVEGRSATEMQSDLGVNAALTGLALGISSANLLQANGNVANNDFLRIDGTAVGGRTVAEVMSDLSGAAGAAFSLNSQKITSLATPTAGTDAATKAYVDSVAEGLEVKESVKAASVGNITGTYNAGNGTITAGSNGALGIQDGYQPVADDRILVRAQTDDKQNGIYVVTTVGDGSNPYVLTRSSDYNADSDISTGNFFFVEQGNDFADTGHVMSNHEFTGLNSASGNTGKIQFTQFSGAGSIQAGDGLDKSGSTLSLDLKANGGLVIDSTEVTVDLSASGITGTLAVSDGGSGQTTYTDGQLLIGNSSGNTLAKATLTGGSGVEVTNGNGSISIAVDRKANAGLVDDSGELKIDLAQSAVEGVNRFSGASQKNTIVRSGSQLAADADFAIADSGNWLAADFEAAAEEDREIYLNGMLLLEGANAGADNDWYEKSSGNLAFEFALEVGDIITMVYRKV